MYTPSTWWWLLLGSCCSTSLDLFEQTREAEGVHLNLNLASNSVFSFVSLFPSARIIITMATQLPEFWLVSVPETKNAFQSQASAVSGEGKVYQVQHQNCLEQDRISQFVSISSSPELH